MMASKPASFPTKALIARTVAAARACGIDVAGFEVSAGGQIRVFDARAQASRPDNDFDRWENEL